ncbi:MAG: metallophosphoesterase family protein [Anaerolineae bacterium]|nr:metallophosphoesterase family protein [Anaerolineae bacterium]
MKIAVISDIHGNRPALEAVIADLEHWGAEQVIVAGDVINRGPDSPGCADIIMGHVREQGWRAILGNHEEYVLSHALPETPTKGPRFEINRISYWTYHQMNSHLPAVAAWPLQVTLPALEGSELHAYHASGRGTRDGIWLDTPEDDLRAQVAAGGLCAPAMYCTGHTHWPLIRRIDSTLIANAGSVGTPADGDPRASYARVSYRRGEWQAEIRRVDYDRRATHRAYLESDFLPGCGPLALLLYHEWWLADYVVPSWAARYQQAVLDGSLTLAQSVSRFMREERLPLPGQEDMSPRR